MFYFNRFEISLAHTEDGEVAWHARHETDPEIALMGRGNSWDSAEFEALIAIELHHAAQSL